MYVRARRYMQDVTGSNTPLWLQFFFFFWVCACLFIRGCTTLAAMMSTSSLRRGQMIEMNSHPTLRQKNAGRPPVVYDLPQNFEEEKKRCRSPPPSFFFQAWCPGLAWHHGLHIPLSNTSPPPPPLPPSP